MEFEYQINTQQINPQENQFPIQQLNQLNQSKQITISRSDFNIDEILSLLEEEELKGRKRTYDDLLNQENQQPVELLGFMTAKQFQEFQTTQDKIKFPENQQKRSVENQSN